MLHFTSNTIGHVLHTLTIRFARLARGCVAEAGAERGGAFFRRRLALVRQLWTMMVDLCARVRAVRRLTAECALTVQLFARRVVWHARDALKAEQVRVGSTTAFETVRVAHGVECVCGADRRRRLWLAVEARRAFADLFRVEQRRALRRHHLTAAVAVATTAWFAL